MSDSQPSTNKTEILGTFASVLGVLGIFLYFTAWIYRWAYFGFFQLELTKLSFPLRSYFFVPIQVFLGDNWAFTRTALALILVAIAIKITLWFLQPLNPHFVHSLTPPVTRRIYLLRLKWSRYAQKLHQFPLSKFIRNLASLVPSSLQKDLVIVIWLLVALFWLARFQGWEDARRDVVNETSTLPVFSYIFPKKQLLLGRNLDNIFLDPELKEYRIIGDLKLFDYLQGIETNDTKLTKPIVWRLLLENNNWIYCFPALSKNAEKNAVPPILAIREDKEGQFLILSPDIPN